MFSMEQLYTALQNADAAGDVEAAKQIAQMIQQNQFTTPQQAQQPESATAGPVEALVGGTKRIASDVFTGVSAPFVGAEEAAERGIARQEQITERPGTSLEEVKRVYKERGVFPAIGEVLSQVPSAIAEQAPFLATMWAGGKAGAALPGTPQTKLITGFIGAALSPFLVQSGSNLQRQAEEQIAQGENPDVSMAKAYGAATTQAALDVFSLQFGLGKLLGFKPIQFGTERAERLAKENLTKMLAKGAGKTALAEIPTEMTQQLIERLQAGLELTSPEAVSEYMEAGYAAGLISPIGSVSRASERGSARQYLATKEAQAKQAMQQSLDAELSRISELEATEAEKQRLIDEAEAKAQQERNAVLANIYFNPGKSVQDIINEATGVSIPEVDAKERAKRKKAINEELDQPSGIFTRDPFTQQERELTVGEYQGIVSPELDVEQQAPALPTDKTTETTFTDMGIGKTAKLVKNLAGLDPLEIEDNDKIRRTLEGYLKTRETEDPRAIKVQEYLNSIPTTEELQYDPTIRERLGEDISVSGGPVPLSTTEALGGYDGTGPDSVPVNLRELAGREDERSSALNRIQEIDKELKKKPQGPTLISVLKSAGGINTIDFQDLVGDTARGMKMTPGVVTRNGKELSEIINDNVNDINRFLPFEMRKESPSFDPQESAQYLADKLRTGEQVISFEEQRTRDELNSEREYLADEVLLRDKKEQMEYAAELGLTPQEEAMNEIMQAESEEIREESKIPVEEAAPVEQPTANVNERIEALLAEQNTLTTQMPEFVKRNDRAGIDRLKDRYNAINDELASLGYRRDLQFAEEVQPIADTGATSESITVALENEFGPSIRQMQRRGRLIIADTVDGLPPVVKQNVTPRSVGAYSKSSGVSYLIANRIRPENARRVLLHEIGEHYGLPKMLGEKNYKAALNRLKTLKNTDDVVKRAWDQTKKAYPKLAEGSDGYLSEVMAKVAEGAPNMTLITRLRGLIKNFLTRIGLYNPDTFTSRDLQDLLIHSLRTSLARELSPTKGEGIQLSEQERTELLGMTDESISNIIRSHANTVVDNVGKGWVTMMSPDQFLQLTTSPRYRETLEKQVEQGLGTFKFSPLKNKGKFDIKSMKPMFLEVSDFPVREAGVGDGIPFEYTPEGGYDTEVIKGVPLGVDVKGHEGRHRAIMAKKAGITQMPVMIFSNTAKTKRDVIQERDGPTLRAQVEGQPSVILSSEMIPINYANEQNIRNMMQGTDIQFMEVPADMKGTEVFGKLQGDDKSFYENFVNKFDSVKENPKGSLQDMFVKGRIKVASSTAGVEEKLIKDYNGAVNGAMGEVRADILLNQGLESNIMASQAAEEGKVDFIETGMPKVVPDENNFNKLIELREQLGKEIQDPVKAKYLVQHYTVARRFQREVELNQERVERIADLKRMIKEQKQVFKNSQGRGQAKIRNNAEKLIERYKRLIILNKKATTQITDEQIDAIPVALAYAQEYPILTQIGNVIDGINKNRIDMLEKAGFYDKDTADFYRSNLGYVPLQRVIDNIAEVYGKDNYRDVKEYFQGFANLGREYEFKGSARDIDDVLNNMLKQHFWAVNAAVRNNANFQTAKALGTHRTVTDLVTGKEVEELITLDKVPDGPAGESVAPVFIDGERKYIQYTDPNLAIAIQGQVPAFTGFIGAMGQFSKLFRLGITSNPVFQTYQVVNDAISAGLFSGVKNPFALAKEVIAGFAKDTFNASDAINKQMARLGVAGGYGKTARDIYLQSERKFGLANKSVIKKLYDSVDKFASKSDLAQRRGIFVQTLLETGGVRQPDGSIVGGNEVLAMNRALNIINWQKRGLATPVRALTHMVPFLNAYIQGLDVMLNAMRGKGISGMEAGKARWLFLRTAVTLMALNGIYSMLVAGDDEYDSQDDRTKFRNYFIPGTGFKMPVRAEVAFLTKYVPEQLYQMNLKRGTKDEIDSKKLADAFKRSFLDAMLSPNLFPQVFRSGAEVLFNYDFYNDRPLVGMGLNRLATSEQFNESTSEFGKWIGSSGLISPISVDHLIRGYTGTIGATGLYITDAMANMFMTNKRPERPFREMPLIAPIMMRPEGRDKLNDFYDLKQMSDEVTATLNRYLSDRRIDKAQEYRQDNRKLLAVRNQVNAINNKIKKLREQRKTIVNSASISAKAKHERLQRIDQMMSRAVSNVSQLRRRAGL